MLNAIKRKYVGIIASMQFLASLCQNQKHLQNTFISNTNMFKIIVSPRETLMIMFEETFSTVFFGFCPQISRKVTDAVAKLKDYWRIENSSFIKTKI